jgi:hypothetical protein
MSDNRSMSLRFPIALVLSIICLAAPAWADYEAGLGAYERGDYATALREWRPLAEQGIADAQFNLGQLYANGQGVPQDYVRARQWYEKAAVQGEVLAQFNLGGYIWKWERGSERLSAGLVLVSSVRKSRKCNGVNTTWPHLRAWERRDAGFCPGP